MGTSSIFFSVASYVASIALRSHHICSVGKCIPTTKIYNIDTPNSSSASWNASSNPARTESKRQVYGQPGVVILDLAVLPRGTQGTLHLFWIWGHCQPAVEMAPWLVFYYQGTTPKNVSINRFIQTFLKRKLLDYFVGGWRILVIHGGILVVDALKSFLGGGTEDLQLLHHHESWLRRACWTARQLKGFVPHSGHDGARLCALISISLGSDDDSKSEGFFQCRSDWVNMCCMELWT